MYCQIRRIFNIKTHQIITVIAFLILSRFYVYAQQQQIENLDSLYYKFLLMHGKTDIPSNFITKGLSLEERKCGSGLFNSVKLNLNRFTPKQQIEIMKLLQRPELQTSIVSQSGRFRIHFDTTGSDAPAYSSLLSPYENALEVSMALDSAYNFEVNYLGYPPPPKDNGQGGDNLVDIYILYIGAGYYGSTNNEDIIDENKQTYTSFIEIDPAFGSNFYTHGLNAMRVTVAHELHHSIQLGNYTDRYDLDGFFYELTSTSMEEFVYDDVNDYYGYIKSYFNYPETPLSSTDGYSSATWNIFLQKRFGYDIIKRQWELMPTLRAMYAISSAIVEYKSSFTGEFNKYGTWMFFTNYRAVPGQYFEEAVHYPLVKIMSAIQFSQASSIVDLSSRAASHIFLPFVNTSNNDSLVAIISNGDVYSAVNSSNIPFDTKYTLYGESLSGERLLTENYSSTFEADDPAFWSVSEILNNVIVRADSMKQNIVNENDLFVFPNPYHNSTQSNIIFAFDGKPGEEVDVNIYTVGMKQVFSSEETVNSVVKGLNTYFGVELAGKDQNGKRLSSGVYIVVVKKGDDIIKGKFVVFN
ncbi:MAG: DUF6055 domain-containing protein [Ignavibacteriaceae bacterium]